MPRPLALTLALAVNHGLHPLFAPRTSESLPIALTMTSTISVRESASPYTINSVERSQRSSSRA